jgi:catechol 2,3-dioxygenase-like lactoylglutathione lyase family enzyme
MSGGGKLTQTTLKNIVMLSKNVEKTSQFFSEILGLKLIHQTKNLAELKDHKDFRLIIKNAPK